VLPFPTCHSGVEQRSAHDLQRRPGATDRVRSDRRTCCPPQASSRVSRLRCIRKAGGGSGGGDDDEFDGLDGQCVPNATPPTHPHLALIPLLLIRTTACRPPYDRLIPNACRDPVGRRRDAGRRAFRFLAIVGPLNDGTTCCYCCVSPHAACRQRDVIGNRRSGRRMRTDKRSCRILGAFCFIFVPLAVTHILEGDDPSFPPELDTSV
jgi:hypothetical protein